MKRLVLLVALLLPSLALAAQAIVPVTTKEIPKYLQVPSPADWRDQVIYFILTDRFNDGNPANSDQRKGEYDPTTNAKYSGGDLAGITQKLDYIKGLGATSIWITPPVANLWWSPLDQYGGYHGYWAENLQQVDKHMGTLEDYQTLTATLHKNGMYLIQDIVPNHMGNFFRFENPGDKDDPKNPKNGLVFNKDATPVNKPTQKPFDQNDFTKAADRKADIYHWTPNIVNSQSKTEMQNYQLSDLDDLNTENPVVINALIDSYNFWIKNAGVDAFRIDTVKYVPHDFWNVFHWNTDKKHLGVMNFATSLGKKNFFTFGEDWETTGAYLDKPDKTMANFLGTSDTPELSSVLNFTLQNDIQDVFSKGRPTDQLTYRFKSQYKNFKDPSLLVNFLDNHDMNRFATSADLVAQQQALALLLTVPGVPVIYYGTEQGLNFTRASMFAKGFASDGADHFDTQSTLYTYIKALTELRASEKEFTHGKLQVVKDAGAAGTFAYTLTYNGRTALVAFNTASTPMVMDNAVTGLPAGTVLKRVFGLADSLAGDAAKLAGTTRYDAMTVLTGGIVHAVLAPRSVTILTVDAAVDPAVAKLAPSAAPVPAGSGVVAITGPADASLKIALDAQKLPIFAENLDVAGTLSGVTEARLLIGGNLASPTPVIPAADGTWKVNLPVTKFNNGVYDSVIQGRKPDGSLFLSAPYRFRVELAFKSVASISDPVGDDHGPTGTYGYPKHSSFTGQNDLKAVEVLTAGSSLQVKVTPATPITAGWAGPNGFDHVAYYIYFQVPGVPGGASVLPLQNGQAPAGFQWNRMAFLGGWNSMLFSAEGASLNSYGAAIPSAAKITIDKAKNQLTFQFSGDALGSPATLSGTKVYVTTWDYDGLESANRKLTREGADYMYSSPADGPLVMDDTAILTLP